MNPKTIIVEDEGVAARRLIKMLQDENLEVIAHCESNASLNQWLDANEEPDLYFFDIHLNDGIIFEVLQHRTLQSPIIFTTAYDQYAIKAFKQNSIDYLLKPIKQDELKRALQEFRSRKKSTSSIDIETLSSLLISQNKSNHSYRERIRVKIADKIKTIPIQEITHIYSENKSSYIHTTEGRAYPIDYSIEEIYPQLNPKDFYRVSRSHIVSIRHIENAISYSSSRLKVIIHNVPNAEIIVARDRVKDFKNWMG